MGHLSRLPNPNDPPQPRGNPWGGNELVDDTALLLGGDGARCAACRRVIRNEYLREHAGKKLCPDCIPT